MTSTLSVTIRDSRLGDVRVEMEVMSCINCGVLYAGPKSLFDNHRKNKGKHYCVNGHGQGWLESEADKLRKQLKQAEADREWYKTAEKSEREQRQATERSLRATKGVATKLRNRTLSGKCPLCGSHLANLDRHVARMHPDEKPEPEESAENTQEEQK